MIDETRQQELIQLLNRYDVSGVPFYTAKKELLAKGYGEAEIVYALYSAPFDGKINEPMPSNPLTEMYQKNPERADKIAKNLLAIEAEKEWEQTKRGIINSQVAVGTRYEAQAGVALADSIGIPYISILLGTGIGTLICVFAGVPDWIVKTATFILSVGLNIWVFTVLIRRYRRLRKLRKQAKLDK